MLKSVTDVRREGLEHVKEETEGSQIDRKKGESGIREREMVKGR